jgi:toxin ParE1/3/4
MSGASRRFRMSPEARLDLIEIRSHLMEQSEQAWPIVFRALWDACGCLSRMPGLGHRRSDLENPRWRCLSVYSYLIIYEWTARPIRVIRIVHGARLVREALRTSRDK